MKDSHTACIVNEQLYLEPLLTYYFLQYEQKTSQVTPTSVVIFVLPKGIQTLNFGK